MASAALVFELSKLRIARRGFTLAEMMIVIGITVVLAGAAIPGGLKALNGMRQMHLNRSAETIFMTAQRNLVAAKVTGSAEPDENQTAKSSDKTSDAARTVLPSGTLVPTLYNDGYWIVEYSGWTVDRVYYSEKVDITTNSWDKEAWEADILAGRYGDVGRYGMGG